MSNIEQIPANSSRERWDDVITKIQALTGQVKTLIFGPPLSPEIECLVHDAKNTLKALHDDAEKKLQYTERFADETLETQYWAYEDFCDILRRKFSGIQEKDSKVWENFSRHLRNLNRKSPKERFAFSPSLRSVTQSNNSTDFLESFVEVLAEEGGEEIGKTMLALKHIVDVDNPEGESREKIGIKKLAATLAVLTIDEEIPAPAIFIHYAESIKTAADFRIIAERLLEKRSSI